MTMQTTMTTRFAFMLCAILMCSAMFHASFF